jgi:hypothetical protein
MVALRKHCETALTSGPVYVLHKMTAARICRFPGRIGRIVYILHLSTKSRPMESAAYTRFALAASRKRRSTITTCTRDWERHFPWPV